MSSTAFLGCLLNFNICYRKFKEILSKLLKVGVIWPRIMAKRNRYNSAAAWGIFNRERPRRYIVTPDYQSEIPFEKRHKFWMLVYSNGRIVKRSLKKPSVGVSIRSNMLTIMPLAMYKRSKFSSDEIKRRRFRTLEMNDNWRAWDEKIRIDKIIKKRQEGALVKRIIILSGLPSVSCR